MKIKYFLRGLGVGILVTALLLFIGQTKAEKPVLSDQEIMNKAKQLGMLTKEEASDYRMDKNLDQMKESLGATTSPQPVETAVPVDASKAPAKDETKKTSKPAASPSVKPKEKKEKKQESKKSIELKIESGMTATAVARLLYKQDVIRNKEDFVTYMTEHNLNAKLQVGKYQIPIDATHAEIAEIITKK